MALPDPTVCSSRGCTKPPRVQWSRRPTPDELAALVAAEQARRESMGASTEVPPRDFGPLPTAGDVLIAVFGCAEHALHLDHASRVHAADCSAPHPEHVPGCDCEPEPAPAQDWMITRPGALATLPTGWVVPAPATERSRT